LLQRETKPNETLNDRAFKLIVSRRIKLARRAVFRCAPIRLPDNTPFSLIAATPALSWLRG
jgi:hypothetical protein